MKISKLLFVLSMFCTSIFIMNFIQVKETVEVTIHITNEDNLPFEKGTLSIIETGETYEVNEVKDFTIPLKQGKYHFKFNSETHHFITYPARINAKDNWVLITLKDSNNITNSYANSGNIQDLVKSNKAQFIVFGIVSEDYTEFKEKYGVGVKTENCVITSYLSKVARENNEIVAQYLNENFGTSWKEDLKIIPFGLE